MPIGSPDEFEQGLIALIPQLRAFGRSLTGGNQAFGDDLVQDALMRALSSRRSFQPGTNLKAWTFMILRNLFYSEKRRSWRSSELDPDMAERTLVAITNPDGRLQLDELRRAMAMLPDEQREALILVGAAGLSYEDTAAIVGAAVGTIKSRVSRARTRLAGLLFDGDFDDEADVPEVAMDAIFAQIRALQARQAA